MNNVQSPDDCGFDLNPENKYKADKLNYFMSLNCIEFSDDFT